MCRTHISNSFGNPAVNQAKPGTLQRSVDPRFFVPDTALNRIIEEAAYLSRCSDNKTAMRVRPREHAIRYPYMQINRLDRVSWLIFDLDHANSLIWDEAHLPPPNLIVRNRHTGSSHLYYAIVPVCTSDSARNKPILYMKAVYRAFAVQLKADLGYHGGPVAKTPGHPWWDTRELHQDVYELADLAECVNLEPITPWGKGPNVDAVSHSRHCVLFENVRFFAYSIVNHERQNGSYDHFMQRLTAHAHNSNRFAGRGAFSQDLPLSSIRSTVRSIARWTWNCYTGNSRCHRGVMELDKGIPLELRQRLAAKRTHEVRHKASESKIRAACTALLEQNKPLTITALSSLTGLCRQTVATYKHVINEPRTNVVIPLAKAVEPAATANGQSQKQMHPGAYPLSVKHGANQIPAVRVLDLLASSTPSSLLFVADPGADDDTS
jgi:hypothetical protein